MRRFLPLLFIGVTLVANSQSNPPQNSSNSLFVPWKPLDRSTYTDKEFLAWKQKAGLNLSNFLGVEGLFYYGNYDDRLRYTGEELGFTRDGSQTVNLMGVGKIPLSHAFSFFAKAGPSYYQPNLPGTASGVIPVFNNVSEWGLSYSAGASINFNPRLQLSLEHMRTENDLMEEESNIVQLGWDF